MHRQSLLQVAEAHVFDDLSTADEYVMLARAQYDALAVKPASTAVSLLYVKGMLTIHAHKHRHIHHRSRFPMDPN